MKNTIYTIYYLTTEKDQMKPRYVGCTYRTLKERLIEHRKDSKHHVKKKKATYKDNWLVRRLRDGYEILIFTIETTDNLEDCLLLERKNIALYENLTNSTSGGETSKSFSKEVRDKISKSVSEGYKRGFTEAQLEYYESLRIKFPYDELYDLYITQNLTYKEIMEKTGLTISNLRQLFDRYKLIKIKKEKYGSNYGHNSKIPDKYKEEIIDLYNNGDMSLKDIAKKYNVKDYSTITEFLKRNNIPVGKYGTHKRKNRKSNAVIVLDEHKEDIINMYNSGIKIEEIGAKYGFKKFSIRKFLKRNNVKKRKISLVFKFYKKS